MADREWAEAPPNVQRAIEAAWENGMPPVASASYSRWWQLETWLRSLVYVELRAERGAAWRDVMSKKIRTAPTS